jgi:hypothetical protein
MPKAVGNWSLLNFGEGRNLELDFTDSLADGDAVNTLTDWGISVAVGADPTPGNRILPVPTLTGNKTQQRFTALPNGSGIIVYLLWADVVTQNGEPIKLWSYLPCAAPGTCLPPGVMNGLC